MVAPFLPAKENQAPTSKEETAVASVWLINAALSRGSMPQDTAGDIECIHRELGQFGTQPKHAVCHMQHIKEELYLLH